MNNEFLSKVYKWLAIGLLITFGCGYFLSLNIDLFLNIINVYPLFVILEVGIGLGLVF